MVSINTNEGAEMNGGEDESSDSREGSVGSHCGGA